MTLGTDGVFIRCDCFRKGILADIRGNCAAYPHYPIRRDGVNLRGQPRFNRGEGATWVPRSEQNNSDRNWPSAVRLTEGAKTFYTTSCRRMGACTPALRKLLLANTLLYERCSAQLGHRTHFLRGAHGKTHCPCLYWHDSVEGGPAGSSTV